MLFMVETYLLVVIKTKIIQGWQSDPHTFDRVVDWICRLGLAGFTGKSKFDLVECGIKG